MSHNKLHKNFWKRSSPAPDLTIFGHMSEDLEKSTEGVNGTAADTARSDNSARIKRMRSWMGIKSNAPYMGHADNNEPLLPGEGHSGWNR